MSETPDCILYPLHRCKNLHCCKILHLVRHAQGYHNAAAERNHDELMSYDFIDASVSPLGWKQIDDLRKQVASSRLASTIELVVVSPLTRAMQTAAGAFGGGNFIDCDSSPPLMVAGAGKSDRAAISSSDCPTFLAHELCREHIGLHPCDKRKSISEYQSVFPGINFSLIETDEDILWKPDAREKEADIAARGKTFLNWILMRKEKEIAVVTHSNFLKYTLHQFGKDCHPLVRDEIHKPFDNCELRSFVIVDKSAVGSNSPMTNNLQHIHPGTNVPDDANRVGKTVFK